MDPAFAGSIVTTLLRINLTGGFTEALFALG
jgi:hypothetical protein